MAIINQRPAIALLAALLAAAAPGNLSAQVAPPVNPPENPLQNSSQNPPQNPAPTQIVTGQRIEPGAEIKGIISARSGDKMQVQADDGTMTIITIDNATRVKGKSGLFGRSGNPTAAALINGLPVTVKTLQTGAGTDAGSGLVATEISFGYADDVGNEDFNQTLSEQRASKVMNHLQQVFHWKPFRMLTPTGMAESDPAAGNTTAAGKAQNRRVAVNILVSKAVDMQ